MLLKKIIKVILMVLNDPEINALIRSFFRSLTDEEKEEVKNELGTKSPEGNDVVDEVKESNNSEAR